MTPSSTNFVELPKALLLFAAAEYVWAAQMLLTNCAEEMYVHVRLGSRHVICIAKVLALTHNSGINSSSHTLSVMWVPSPAHGLDQSLPGRLDLTSSPVQFACMHGRVQRHAQSCKDDLQRYMQSSTGSLRRGIVTAPSC